VLGAIGLDGGFVNGKLVRVLATGRSQHRWTARIDRRLPVYENVAVPFCMLGFGFYFIRRSSALPQIRQAEPKTKNPVR
jgi:hypothetical protein